MQDPKNRRISEQKHDPPTPGALHNYSCHEDTLDLYYFGKLKRPKGFIPYFLMSCCAFFKPTKKNWRIPLPVIVALFRPLVDAHGNSPAMVKLLFTFRINQLCTVLPNTITTHFIKDEATSLKTNNDKKLIAQYICTIANNTSHCAPNKQLFPRSC